LIKRKQPAVGPVTSVCRDAAIVGRADGRKCRGEQLLAHLVGCGEATVEIETKPSPDFRCLGSCERNSVEPKARRAE